MICLKCNREFTPGHANQKKFCSKECQSRYNVKLWRKKYPAKDAKHKRIYSLKKDFGLTEKDYDNLFEKQNGRCAICMKTSERRLDVDHCHTTGKIRGLLCNQCNQALGLLKDDPLIIKAALEYVS